MFDPVYKENRIENLNKLTPFMRKTESKTVQEKVEQEEKQKERTPQTRCA